MKIHLDHQMYKYKKQIQDRLDDMLLYDANCNGLEFTIHEDECTYIDCVDESVGIKILDAVLNVYMDLTS